MGQEFNFLFLVAIVGFATVESLVVLDYTWEDYDGEVPENALLAGHGEDNETLIYIGQGPYDEKIMPGKLYQNDPNVYFEFGGKGLSTNESVKIFCTDNRQNFHWIPVHNYELLNMLEKTTLVGGGYEANFLTFIGRILVKDKMEVGKIICRETDCMSLYINNDGKSEEYSKFEVLTYKTHTENVVSDVNVEEDVA